SGYVLSEMLGISDFAERVALLSQRNLVQQGGELAYLLVHDEAFQKVRLEHLWQVGKSVRLKYNIGLLAQFAASVQDGCRFSFYVISAAPEEVIRSALEGLVPAENIFGTRFAFHPDGSIQSLLHVPAGYGKVVVLDELQSRLNVPPDRVVYIGDGSSD